MSRSESVEPAEPAEPAESAESADAVQALERLIALYFTAVDNWAAAKMIRTFAVSALIGAGLHWLAPAWWPLGAAIVLLNLVNLCIQLRVRARGKPVPGWAVEAERRTADLADHVPPHVARAAGEALAVVRASRWRWPGAYVLAPPCPHVPEGDVPDSWRCADQACATASAGADVWATIMIGEHAFDGASEEEVRAVLLHEAEHMRGWQPVAGMLMRMLRIFAPALATWAAPLPWAVPAVIGVYLAVIAVRWAGEITADLGSARRADPRAAAAFVEAKRRPPHVRRRRPWLSRAAAALLPFHPPKAVRATVLRNRLTVWRYQRYQNRRRGSACPYPPSTTSPPS